jgi:hypothetical protein
MLSVLFARERLELTEHDAQFCYVSTPHSAIILRQEYRVVRYGGVLVLRVAIENSRYLSVQDVLHVTVK